MILHIVVFKNVKIGAFTQPQFIDIEPNKAAVQLKRSLTIGEKDKILPYENLKMFYIGDFDDETGKIMQQDPVLLLDCAPIVKEVLDYGEDTGNK